VFYTAVDRALQYSPSELAIVHGKLPAAVNRIFIPYGENVHTRLALEMAPSLAQHFRAQVTVGVVLSPDKDGVARDATVAKVREQVADNALPATIKVITARDVVRGVVGEALNADLIVMGGRTGSIAEIVLGSSLSEEITQQVRCPVLWLEEYEVEESLLGRALGGHGKPGEGQA
jgi:hypothetical protein